MVANYETQLEHFNRIWTDLLH